MKISVVMPCFNERHVIEQQLEALAGQECAEPWELIVADNGSSDGSLGIVERYRGRIPGLRIVDASDARGAGHARNVGARHARGELLLFCDADDVVAPGWIAAMSAALAKWEFVASRYDAEKLNDPWLLAVHRCPQQHDVQHYDEPAFLPHAGGGGLGVRRVLHEKVGGFDERMLNLQDTDYCWRIQLAGATLRFVPEALVHIRYPASTKGLFRQARKYAEYNVLIYKNYRARGMPKLHWKDGVLAWVNLLRSLPRVRRSREERARWAWEFAWRIGRLQGSMKHRVLAI